MRTVNRMPTSVRIPNIKDKFFNYVNWKGLSESQNILQSDQESFEDANNVYVNSDNLLQSRPPITPINNYGLTNIINIWSIKDLLILQTFNNDEYQLHFIKDNKIVNSCVVVEACSLVLVENKIFIFAKDIFIYFNTEYNTCGDAHEYIYTPITKIFTNGIPGLNESKNELTSNEIHRYIYSNESNVDFSKFLGKDVTITIGEDTYNYTNFEENKEKTFVQPLTELTNTTGLLISDVQTFIKSYWDLIYYSVDGLSYNTLPKISSLESPMLGSQPFFSRDGSTVFVFKETGLYAYSVAETTEYGLKYPVWTKISDFNSKTIDAFYSAIFLTEDLYAYYFIDDASQDWIVVNIGDGERFFETNLTISTDDWYSPYSINLDLSVTADGALISMLYCDTSRDVYIIPILVTDSDIIKGTNTQLLGPDELDNPPVNDYGTRNLGHRIRFISSANGLTFNVYVAAMVQTATSFLRTFTINITNLSSPIFSISSIAAFMAGYETVTKFIISSDGAVLADRFLFYDGTQINLLFEAQPLYYDNNIIYSRNGNKIYTSILTNPIYIDMLVKAPYTSSIPEYFIDSYLKVTQLNNLFLSRDNVLYITSNKQNDEGDFLWYIPKLNTQRFNHEITNLHILSKSELGIFFEDEIWYTTYTELGYTFTKSNLKIGCKKGANIITLYDNKNIIFATERGLAALSLQDIVSSTEYNVTFLSNVINNAFLEFSKTPVKLLIHKYWILCYNDNKYCYLYDTRNNSWWKWSYKNIVSNVIKYNDDILLLSLNNLFKLNTNYVVYKDGIDTISWHFVSQKLHFKYFNNYKHIINLMLHAIGNDTNTSVLTIKNYRSFIDIKEPEILEYNTNFVGTFIKRLNFYKVSLFQYILQNDEYNALPKQLTLSSISIKYGIKEQVR